MKPIKTCGTAVAVVALGLALAGCGSDTKAAPASSSSASSSSSSSASSSAAPSESKPASGANQTIADYIKEAGITETPTKRGDPGSPEINLPVPAGWSEAGDKTPPYAWGAILFGDPASAADPPTIVALMSKLTGPVEAPKVLQFAAGELNNLPGYDGAKEGQPTTLGGFDGVQLGGSYVKDGAKRMIAQKTVVIPAKDGSGLYVLQLNANGTENDMSALLDATGAIDENTTITP